MTRQGSIFNRVGPVAVALFSMAFLVAAPSMAIAREAGEADAGHQLAAAWCSNCHVIGSEQQQGTSTGAPPFGAIANMKTTTALGLHAFLQAPHDRMPDLHLNRKQTDNIVSYIVSLRQPHRP
jgi:mono/diheme cytochrome c family protein